LQRYNESSHEISAAPQSLDVLTAANLTSLEPRKRCWLAWLEFARNFSKAGKVDGAYRVN
jgi:hypothetical protein